VVFARLYRPLFRKPYTVLFATGRNDFRNDFANSLHNLLVASALSCGGRKLHTAGYVKSGFIHFNHDLAGHWLGVFNGGRNRNKVTPFHDFQPPFSNFVITTLRYR
jgi:hypothetical protein